MNRFIDETGHSYSRLTVIRRTGIKHGSVYWLCQCVCGCTSEVLGDDLRSGHTRSCGCLVREVNTTHNEAPNARRTVEYRAWSHMKDRCLNPKCRVWRWYGGRGIQVCARWRDSYEAFLADMGRCPPGLTLDRCNNNGNYEPDNCRWASWKSQQANKRSPVFAGELKGF